MMLLYSTLGVSQKCGKETAKVPNTISSARRRNILYSDMGNMLGAYDSIPGTTHIGSWIQLQPRSVLCGERAESDDGTPRPEL